MLCVSLVSEPLTSKAKDSCGVIPFVTGCCWTSSLLSEGKNLTLSLALSHCAPLSIFCLFFQFLFFPSLFSFYLLWSRRHNSFRIPTNTNEIQSGRQTDRQADWLTKWNKPQFVRTSQSNAHMFQGISPGSVVYSYIRRQLINVGWFSLLCWWEFRIVDVVVLSIFYGSICEMFNCSC